MFKSDSIELRTKYGYNYVMVKNEFCQQPSDAYLQALEESNEDPRSVAGKEAIAALRITGGPVQPVDARDTGGNFLSKIIHHKTRSGK